MILSSMADFFYLLFERSVFDVLVNDTLVVCRIGINPS